MLKPLLYASVIPSLRFQQSEFGTEKKTFRKSLDKARRNYSSSALSIPAKQALEAEQVKHLLLRLGQEQHAKKNVTPCNPWGNLGNIDIYWGYKIPIATDQTNIRGLTI